MKKAFITGISGFAGSHLAELLVSKGEYEVSGAYLNESGLESLKSFKDSLVLYSLDLNNREKVFEVISEAKPDLVFHLAALAATAESFNNPGEVISNNISSQINVLDALVKNNLIGTKVLVVSSAEVYGIVPKEKLPISEGAELRPVNPYGVSKIAQDFMGLQFFLAHGLPVVRVRPFNHIGPRQSPSFAISAFAKKIAEIEKGIRPPILTVGNLETTRDFTDVRDMAKAYELSLEKGVAGDVYNIGSGVSHKLLDVLNKLVAKSSKEIKVEIEQSLLRKNDVVDLLCDNRKFCALTGWKTNIPLETTLQDTLDYWRNSV